jgi:uncharacterized protein (DUF58 family)
LIVLRGTLARIRARDPLWGVYPTPRLACVVLVASVAWLVPGRTGVLAAAAIIGVMAAAVALDYVRLPGAASVSAQRTAPPVVGLGDAETIRYMIRSTWAWPIRVRAVDELPPTIDAATPRDILAVEPRGELAIDVPATANERGKFALGAVALRIATPLGLVERIVRFKFADDIVVVPSLSNVRRFRLLAAQNRLSDAGVRTLKQRGEGNAFAGLRGYVPGDDPRLVDWKATARHSQLIVREQTIERSQAVISLVDCGRAMTQLAGRYSRFEHVLSAALVLTDVAAVSGDLVGMMAFDDAVRAYVPPQRSAAALRGVRTALTSLTATMTEPDYAGAFRLLATRQPRRALVVLFTDVVDARTARSFIGHANRAGRRHLLVVVAIQNNALLAAARPTTQGSLALFRSAAAEELVREREEALVRMRRAGITVLDVSPDTMAAAVVNRYLEIKSRGLL